MNWWVLNLSACERPLKTTSLYELNDIGLRLVHTACDIFLWLGVCTPLYVLFVALYAFLGLIDLYQSAYTTTAQQLVRYYWSPLHRKHFAGLRKLPHTEGWDPSESVTSYLISSTTVSVPGILKSLSFTLQFHCRTIFLLGAKVIMLYIINY